MLTTRHTSDYYTFKTEDGFEYEAIRTQKAARIKVGYDHKITQEVWAVTRKSPDGTTENLRLCHDIEEVRALAAKHEPQQRDFYRMACGLPEM